VPPVSILRPGRPKTSIGIFFEKLNENCRRLASTQAYLLEEKRTARDMRLGQRIRNERKAVPARSTPLPPPTIFSNLTGNYLINNSSRIEQINKEIDKPSPKR
jgi:hypothetical protein